MTNMKDTIRNALVSKLQSSSLDSITVTDIATDCGISRQASAPWGKRRSPAISL